jgi:signal transduction histidine kinase/PAS domain-containing protein
VSASGQPGKTWRDLPWAGKLGILFASLSLLPLTVVAVYNDVTMRRQLVRAAQPQNLQRARGTAEVLDRYLGDVLADMVNVAMRASASGVLRHDATPEARARLAGELERSRRIYGFNAFHLTDAAGRVVVTTDTAAAGRQLGSRPYFRSAIAGEPSVDAPRYSRETGRVFLHVSAPVQDRGTTVGTAIGRLTLSVIDQAIAADTGFGGRGEFGVLWDDLGVRLSQPSRPADRFRPLSPLPRDAREVLGAESRFGPRTAQLLAGASDLGVLVERSRQLVENRPVSPLMRFDTPRGRIHAAIVPLRNKPWRYGILAPEAEIVAVAAAQTHSSLVIALLTGLAAVGAAVAAARLASRPLSRVGEAAKAIASGDLGRRVSLDQRDEVGQLAAAFDAMADAVSAKNAELHRHAAELERRAEERTEALRASEAELRALVVAIPDLLFRIDREGRLLDFISAKDEELLVPPEKFLGRHLRETLPAEVADVTMRAVECTIVSGEPQIFEYQLAGVDGVRHFEARMVVSGADEVLAIVRNITERKQAEKRVRFLAQASATLAASLDLQDTLNRVAHLSVPFLADSCEVDILEGPAVEHAAIDCADPRTLALVREIRARYPPASRPEHPLGRALVSGEAQVLEEVDDDDLVGMAADEDHLRLLRDLALRSLLVVPLVGRDRILGAMTFTTRESNRRYAPADVAVAVDLGRRAAIAVENAGLYRELQELNRIKDDFLGTVSHELRTPLNAMLGWARLLRSRTLDPVHAGKALETIERNAHTQAQLIDDLLDMSRIVSGKLSLVVESIDLAGVIDAAIDAVRPAAAAKQIAIDVRIDARGALASGDPSRLQQVVWNLLSNSIKFTPPHGRVDVTLAAVETALEIRVRDTGVGIDSEFLPFAFDRFRQADSTTTRTHGGLGLGLAIVRHLTELHGGTVEAQSEGRGRGATFIVRLPRRIAPEGSPARHLVSESTDSPRASGTLAGLRLLVVDDQRDARDLVAAALALAGADVILAESSEEAVRRLGEGRVDALIADIGMPGEDGYDLVRRAKSLAARLGRTLPSIAVTAYAGETNRQRALDAGFESHFAKPVEPADLVAAVAALTGRSLR